MGVALVVMLVCGMVIGMSVALLWLMVEMDKAFRR